MGSMSEVEQITTPDGRRAYTGHPGVGSRKMISIVFTINGIDVGVEAVGEGSHDGTSRLSY